MGATARTAGALTPTLPTTPAGTTYPQVRVYGQPGTQGIPSPRPAAIPPNAMVASTQGSHRAPDWFFPSIYYTTPANMHPPVGLFRDNELPVPATPLRALPRVRMRARRTGGATDIRQPAVVQRWSTAMPLTRGGRGG
jgi:hypothetical protein